MAGAAFDYDLFVIGAGSGGVAASRRASRLGARVAIAEMGAIGGTCVNRGCIPKKLFVYAAEFAAHFDAAEGFGWERPVPMFDWPSLIAAKDTEITRLSGVYRKLLIDGRVTLMEGRARLTGPNTVEVNGDAFTAADILIATGGAPHVPDIPGADLGFTSDAAFHLSDMPDRVVIVGGGYIGVEFAGIFRGLGAAVTIVHRHNELLRGFDEDVCAHLAAELTKAGIGLRLARSVTRIDRQGRALDVTLDDGAVLAADGVMFATGRMPNATGLGLETAGIAITADGAVAVDADSRTTAPTVFAIGDVTDRLQFTPVAIAEGRAVADLLYGGAQRRIDYATVPHAVFSQPAVGAVGLTESQARARGTEVDVYRTVFRPLRATLSGSPGKVLMKLVVDRASQRVLGAHMVGGEAGEIIQGMAVAIAAGATKAHFDATLAIHPTAAEEFVLLREPVAAAKAAE